MGWAGTLVPEDLGGVGGTLADLAATAEGLAAHGVHLPLVEVCAIAPIFLQAAAPEVAARWLPDACNGRSCDGRATGAAVTRGDDVTLTRAGPLAHRLRTAGRAAGAPNVDASQAATHAVLVPAALQPAGDDDIAVFLLEAKQLLAPVATYRTMEGRLAADHELPELELPADACVLRGEAAVSALQRAGQAALLVTGADTVAALGALIQRTIQHLQERRQFGVALATFQVLRHRTADMVVRYLGAKGLVQHAFDEAQRGAADLDRTLALMKMSLAETARTCAEAAIQMHGGMGVSEEVLATRLAQRLLASEFRYGDRLTHAARLMAPPTHPLPVSTPVSRRAP
jgi:alkylation response protein AidB-like acyl-CoA dehydrogenase